MMHTSQVHLVDLAQNNCLISELPHPDDTALDNQPSLYEGPMFGWLLADVIKQMTVLLNSMYAPQIKCTPLLALTSSTNDISMLLYFYFWQLIYFRQGESDWLSV